MSHSIVRLMEPGAGQLWLLAQLGDGRTGYMWHAYVRSPVDYRALFNPIDGQWRMTRSWREIDRDESGTPST